MDLDLAEYAGAGLTSSKRFLLEPYSNTHQRSDNSTLKLSLEMGLLQGDPLFKRPSYPYSSQFYDNNWHPKAVHTPQGSNDAKDEKDRVDSTRVDPEEIVKQLVDQHIPAKPPSVGSKLVILGNEKIDEDDEEGDVGGLELLVGRDGTATLGSRSGTNERKKKHSNNKKKHNSTHQNE